MNCSWCGAEVAADDGWQLTEVARPGRASFCRLEHVVPWQMQGAALEVGEATRPVSAGAEAGAELSACAECGTDECGEGVVLIRHRGEHRIAELFCSTDHLAAWAKAGGPWR